MADTSMTREVVTIREEEMEGSFEASDITWKENEEPAIKMSKKKE
jgi:hypothetical protein